MTSLADHAPHIAAEWDYDRNTDTPCDVTAFSNRKRYWVCSLGHKWEAVVANRVLNRGCPYCGNRKTLSGFNDIGTTHPEIAFQVHPDSPFKAREVTRSSKRKLLWQCQINQDHVWSAVVYSRVTNNSGCPQCVDNHNPRIEKDISDLIPGSVLHQVVTTWPGTSRPLEVDILWEHTVVEYDGFWHSTREIPDTRKTLILLELGYKVFRVRQHPLPLLSIEHDFLTQIPYKYSSKSDSIENLVTQIVSSQHTLKPPSPQVRDEG